MNVFGRAKCVSAVMVSLLLSAVPSALRAEFEVRSGWSDQLFPSFIISTATIRLPEEAIDDAENSQVLGDRQGLLGVTLNAESDDTPVTVTVTCDAIMEPSSYSGTLATAGETYAIFPKIKYKFDALAKRSQPGPITVTFSVEVGDDAAEEQSKTLTLRSINDCPFTIVDDGGEVTDVSFMFAAYVNEQHPYVDKVLREALDTGVIDSFTGYQSKDKAEVYKQVYALWHALTERDLRYSDITTSSAESDSVSSQHVRLIDESINNAQANCVDGSVLLASLLRKVGIEPILVMVPRHCYLGFYLDAECTEFAGLETTLMGSTPDHEPAKVDGLDGVVDDDWKTQNSWLTFTAALVMGTADLEKNAEQFKSDSDPDYQLISVFAARKLGILPIAFQSEQKFVAAPKKEAQGNDEDEEEEEETGKK